MNCQNQTVTVASATTAAPTNMTTLLQKNCIKTLSGNNSVVVVANGNLATGNLTGIGQLATAVPISASTVPNTTFLSGQPIVGIVTAGSSTTRMLLPHEIGSITASYAPISSVSSLTTNSTQQHTQQQLHETFQYHNQQSTQQNHQQFIVYNQNGDVTTMYRPIHALSNTTFYHSQQPLHLNNQQQFVTQQQQNSIPKHNITPITSSQMNSISNYEHIANGYTNQVPQSTAASLITSSSSSLLSHSTINTKPIIISAKTLPTNGTGRNQLNSVNLIKENGITTDGNHALNHPTSTNVTANSSSTNVNTTNANPTPIATQLDNTNSGVIVSSANNVEQEVVVSSDTVPSENDGNGENVTDAVEQEPEPEIDIVINNVVCSFSVRCHLNLREIALNGRNVEFRRENGMVTMKLRRPYTTASIWSSGRITCTGATSEEQVIIEFNAIKLNISFNFEKFVYLG